MFRKAMEEMNVRIETIVEHLNRVGDLEKNKVMALNYEELKNKLKIEDFIYDVFIKRIAEETNRTIEFKGSDILLRRE